MDRIMNARSNLAHDFLLPTLLFAVIGGMTWAIRGCSGFGAAAGCLFAGVTLGTAWWFIAREPGADRQRRYTSGWIILAMTIGFAISGNRGWMQWPAFFRGELQTDYAKGESVPIEPVYGFIWMFIAGIPWGGLGACMLAWCASGKRVEPWQWVLRLAFGITGFYILSRVIYFQFPSVFLPLYDSLHDRYAPILAAPFEKVTVDNNLWKLVRDNREAMEQMGLYLGFIAFEIFRRDWKNVTLMTSVGLINGVGWSLLQNWTWAEKIWPGAQFNFWRCWESSGGISIGIAYGVAYYLVNRRMSDSETAQFAKDSERKPDLMWLGAYLATVALIWFIAPEIMPVWTATGLAVVAAGFGIAYYTRAQGQGREWSIDGQILERWGAYAGLVLGLGISIKCGLKGWANIYYEGQADWDAFFFPYVGPAMIVVLFGVAVWLLRRTPTRNAETDSFPHAYAIVWLVLIVQNIIAQMVTGSPGNWVEMAFALYYVLLFFISAVIVHYFHVMNTWRSRR
jgi:hypothetical protein